jgi:hypothetical protein
MVGKDMAKITFKNVVAFIQGKIRYKLYYSPTFSFLIRRHIREQIDMRISVMDKTCYTSGSCVLCGCTTTALQMANKPCDKPCYPGMMTSIQWKSFKKGMPFVIGDTNNVWVYVNGNKIRLGSVG